MIDVLTHQKYPYVHIVKTDFSDIEKIDFALCNQTTETVDSFYKRQLEKPAIITNGGFFSTSNGNTCFGFKDEFITTLYHEYPGVAVCGDKELKFTTLDNCPECRDFVSAYPPLIIDGKIANITYALELNYRARRTCIGWNDTTYFVVSVDSPGLAYADLQSVFLELGAKYAANLDGGGSTRLLVEGERKTSQVYSRPIDNVMCVYINKEPPTPTLYRVQVGAFLCKQNAENLKQKLIASGFQNPFIAKSGLFYKVQVGAFSVKLNAERLLDRLKAAGYNGFIV